MIGEALYAMLTTLPTIAARVEGRVYPVRFAQLETFPALTFNTRNVQKLPCRVSGGSKEGQLEIAILAKSALDLTLTAETISTALDGYRGTHAGYALSVEVSDDEFDEDAEEISALHKRLQFDFTATKL